MKLYFKTRRLEELKAFNSLRLPVEDTAKATVEVLAVKVALELVTKFI